MICADAFFCSFHHVKCRYLKFNFRNTGFDGSGGKSTCDDNISGIIFNVEMSTDLSQTNIIADLFFLQGCNFLKDLFYTLFYFQIWDYKKNSKHKMNLLV